MHSGYPEAEPWVEARGHRVTRRVLIPRLPPGAFLGMVTTEAVFLGTVATGGFLGTVITGGFSGTEYDRVAPFCLRPTGRGSMVAS